MKISSKRLKDKNRSYWYISMYRRKLRGKRKPKTIKSQLARLKKKVQSIEPEMKEFVTIADGITGNYTGLNTATTGFLPGVATLMNPCLSYVPEGPDYNERIGREIKPKQISIDMVLKAPNEGVLPIPWRLIVFQDRGYSGTPATLAQLIQNPSTAAGSYDTFTAPQNPDFVQHKGDRKNRFKILIDKKGFINPRYQTTSNTAAVPMFNRTGYPSIVKIHAKRSKGLSQMNFQGQNNTDFVGGAIFYFLMLGYEGLAANNPTGYIRSRLLYTDT